jgi:hypothetical protein
MFRCLQKYAKYGEKNIPAWLTWTAKLDFIIKVPMQEFFVIQLQSLFKIIMQLSF